MEHKVNFEMDFEQEWVLAEHRLGQAIVEWVVLDLRPAETRSMLVTPKDVRDAITWVLDDSDEDGSFLWWVQQLRLGDKVVQHIVQMALNLREQI